MKKLSTKRLLALLMTVMLILTSVPMMGGSVSAATGIDLSISKVSTVVSTSYDGDRTKLVAVVRNEGTETAPAGARVDFYYNGILFQSLTTTKDIASGGMTSVSTTLKRRIGFGSHKLTAFINSSDSVPANRLIPESNYKNNVKKERFTVIDEDNPNPLLPDENVIINQVYGGGGKGDTPFSHSFIELYNAGGDDVDLTGYKLTYLSSRSGADNPGSTNGAVESVALTGTIPARTSYLVRCNGETTEANLIYSINKYDATFNQVIDNKQYKVALLKGETVMDSVTSVDAAATVEVKSEGEPVVGITKQKTIRRSLFADTNSNATDFEVLEFKGAKSDFIELYRPRSREDGTWEFEIIPEIPESYPEPNPTVVDKPVSVRVDAGAATKLGGASVSTTRDGYTGTGYVTVDTTNGRGIEFTYDAAEGGNHTVKIRYTTSNNAQKTATVTVNNSATSSVTFSGQQYTDSWAYASVDVNLLKGNNIIKITKESSSSGEFSIDSVEVYRAYSKRMTYFAFLKENNPTLQEDIICDISSSGLISAKIPTTIVDVRGLVATYTCSMPTVKVLDVVQQSGVTKNNFTNGHYYMITDGSTTYKYTVVLEQLNNKTLPNVFVRFEDSVSDSTRNQVLTGSDKELKVPCLFSVELGLESNIINATSTKFTTLEEASATINLRGNSTLHQPKKSWKVKLDSKSSVLDMPSSKHWILLASYDDKSMMRQYTGYELGQVLNSVYAPRARYSNLFINGKYNGVYLLMEQIKIGTGRVEIESIEDTIKTEPNNFSGGYILEIDSREDEIPELRFIANGMKFAFKDPDDLAIITQAVKDEAKRSIEQSFTALNNPSSGEYKQYLDINSFVDYYLIMEIMKNLDAAGNTSIYVYKEKDGKIFMGPIWDFDISSGNMNYSDDCKNTSGFWMKNCLWYGRLFQDPLFVAAVKARYTEFRRGDYNLLGMIDSTAKYLKEPMKDNFEKWDMLSNYYWPEPDVLHTHDAYAKQLYDWMTARLNWLDTQYLL